MSFGVRRFMEREWYFVCFDSGRFEVQLLYADGRARSFIQLHRGDRDVRMDDHSVPISVLEVAERTCDSGGQYVDRNGRLLDFHGNPLDVATA